MAGDVPVTALVPMKGHSERIPDKNLRMLAGQPLCCWVLRTLWESSRIGQIVVNTDSEEIASLVSERFDATVHWRPEDLRGDRVSMNRIIAHDLHRLEGERHFLQTHATNPLLERQTLEHAIERYLSGHGIEHDSLYSVTRHQARFYDSQGNAINHDPNELVPTQELPPLFEENSNLYLFSRESFAARGSRIGPRAAWFEMTTDEAMDIDEPWEWVLAEDLLERR